MHYALPLWYLLGIVAIIKRIRIVSDAAIKRKSHSNWDVNHGVHRFPSNENIGVFHLQLLVFPFVCRFHSRIEAIVCSSFANDKFRRISSSFQNLFVWLLHEKECSFYTYLFCCTKMRWMFIISSAVSVNGWDTSSVASRARSELTSLQCILQMFCLLNPQMNVCQPNPKTTSSRVRPRY